MKLRLASASTVLLAAISASAISAQVTPRVYSPRESANAPQIDLWLDQVTYRVGDRVAPHFVTERGAYVTVVRVTSDGQLRVLYPAQPRDQRPYQQAQLVNDRVPYNSFDRRFEVFESRGTGFVFAIASFDKFDYSYFSSGGAFSTVRLDNDSRYGDPFTIVRRFIDRTLSERSDYLMDYVAYQVTNDAARSRYSSRYGYNSFNDYYDDCITAFGISYTPYCGGRSYYPNGYPIIVANPSTPRPNVPAGNYAGKRIRPVTGDPVVQGPTEPEVAPQGRLPEGDRTNAAAAAKRERMLRDATARDRMPTNVDTRPIEREPRVIPAPERSRSEPMAEPRVFTVPERPRVEPQAPRQEPRIEVRSEPRSQPSPPPPPREETRSEPAPPPPPREEMRSEPAPPPRVEPAPAPAPLPVPPPSAPPPPAPAKDN